MADLHRALRVEPLGEVEGAGFRVKVVRLQNGKNDTITSLHVYPNTYTSSGFQRSDLLSYLGLKRGPCAFFGRECFSTEVSGDFNLGNIIKVLGNAQTLMERADTGLEACGVHLDQPEGWGFFHGRSAQRKMYDRTGDAGDGHAAPEVKRLKSLSDKALMYSFTWIKDGRKKGWVTHYKLLNPESNETSNIAATFKLLNFGSFAECPEFDFDHCYWRFYPYSEDRMPGWGNAEYAQQQFDAHEAHFMGGLLNIIEAHDSVTPLGLRILPKQAAVYRGVTSRQLPDRRGTRTMATQGQSQKRQEYEYDVALSFAGENRAIAEEMADVLKSFGIRVFYDRDVQADLWGKDLYQHLQEVYRDRARFCVIFISEAYSRKRWTRHELRQAQERAFNENREYILPLRLDDTPVPGVNDTTGFLDLRHTNIASVCDMLLQKLKATAPR